MGSLQWYHAACISGRASHFISVHSDHVSWGTDWQILQGTSSIYIYQVKVPNSWIWNALNCFCSQLSLRATSELKDSGRKGIFTKYPGDAHLCWHSSLLKMGYFTQKKMNVVAHLCHCVPFPYVLQESFYFAENISRVLVKRRLSDASALFYCLSKMWQDTPMINRVAVTIRSSNSLAVLAAFMHWIILLSSKLFEEQWQHAELVTTCLCLLVSWLILGVLENP